MFDRKLEFEFSDAETQVSMILSNYYRGDYNEYDYLPEYPVIDPLEITFNEKGVNYLNESVNYTKKQIEKIKRSKKNKNLYFLLK